MTIDRNIIPRPGFIFTEFLKNAGSPDLNVNALASSITFSAGPPTGKLWFIHTITIIIEDNGINFNKFGGGTALTNGVEFRVKEVDLSEISIGTVKRNGDFYIFANNVIVETSNTDFLIAQLREIDNTGSTFQIGATDGGLFKAIVNDNLTGLNLFQVSIRGFEVDE